MAKVRKLFKFHKSTTDLSEWNKNDDKLLKAVEHGDGEKVEALLTRKTLIPTKPGPRGLSVFHLAAASGQLAILEKFLAHSVEVNSTDLQGHTALHLASKNGHPEVVHKLLQMGANQHALDSDHMTSLHHACGSDRMPCVQILIQFEANVNVQDKSGRSALFYCAQRGDAAMCKLLIERGADVNIQDNVSRSALIFAALEGHKDVCELLLQRGANPTFLDTEGMTAIEYSIRGGHNLQDVFDNAPARASWNVAGGGGADKHDKTGKKVSEGINPVDAVRQFSVEHSPDVSARLSSTKLDGELEEEHDILTEELRVLRINHIKVQDKVQFLQERLKLKTSGEDETDGPKIKLLEAEVKKFRQLYVTEQEKNSELENQLEKLEHRLHNEVESEGSVGGTDSWGESEDELFGGPSDKKVKRRKDGTEQLIPMLRSQILTLRQENDHLKGKLQSDEGSELRSPHAINGGEISEIELKISALEEEKLSSAKPSGFGLVNGAKDFSELQQENLNLLHEIDILKDEMSNLKQSSLTNSLSVYSEGESGIIVNGELSRTPSEDDDILRSENKKLQDECKGLKVTLDRLQTNYAALVEAGDKLQMDYDQLCEEKSQVEQEMLNISTEKDELLKENEILTTDGLHEDLEKLVDELEKLQEKYKKVCKEKEELEKRPLNLTINKGQSSSEMARVVEERDKLGQRCEELEETVNRLKHDHEIVIEEVQSLQERYGELQTERDQLQQEVELVQDELDRLSQQFDVMQQEYGQLEQDYAELLADKGKLEQDFLDVETSRARGESPDFSTGVISAQDQEILLQQNNILSSEKELLETKVMEFQGVNEGLEEELKQSKAKMVELQDRLYTLESSSMSTEKELLEGKILEFQKVNDGLKEELKQSKSKMVELQDRLYTLESNSMSTEKELLEGKILEFQKVNEGLKEELKQSKSKMVELQDRPYTLESNSMSTKKDLLEGKILEFQKVNEGLKEELKQSKSKMVELQDRLYTLESKSTEKELLESKVVGFQGLNEGLNVELQQSKSKMADLQDRLDTLESTSMSNTIQSTKYSAEKDKQIRSLQIKISRLQQQVAEMERKHRDTVNTYRTHLISAVQGHMDPDVRQALHHIIEIRGMEEYC